MAKTTLLVTDKNGKKLGVLFLDVDTTQDTSTIFESVSPSLGGADNHPQITIEKRHSNFWASDGVTYAIAGAFAGGVLLTFGWWYEIPMGPIVAGVALVVGVGLHLAKILLQRPPAAPSAPAPKDTVIKVEQISSDGQHWLLEQLDASITMRELQSVAVAVVDKNKWARAITTKAGLSQGKHQKLQSDFLRLHYLEPFANGANGYRVTGMGRRFMLQVANS